jgi:hypothetical protein
MTTEQFKAEKEYHMAIYLMEELHRKGLLDEAEIENVRDKLIDQYKPVISTLID